MRQCRENVGQIQFLILENPFHLKIQTWWPPLLIIEASILAGRDRFGHNPAELFYHLGFMRNRIPEFSGIFRNFPEF